MKTSSRNYVFIITTFFIVVLLFLSCSDKTDMITEPTEASMQLKVLFAPIEVKSTDGKINLMYSLHTTMNFGKLGYKIKDFQVINALDGKFLSTINDTGKYVYIAEPLAPQISADFYYFALVGDTNYCFLVGLVLDPPQVPLKIKHRLILTKGSEEKIIDAEEMSVSKTAPFVLGPPLIGDRFISSNATVLYNNHHPKIVFMNKGNPTIAERYCIDWSQCDASGNLFNGDMSVPENWYVYGQNIYAVADGEITSVTDGMPDQSPVGTVTGVSSIVTGTGNCVTLSTLGGYVTYAHMIKNSIAVKPGQRVTKGQIIGKVGNSGNSSMPHLHIGLHSEFPYYISEGLPHYINSLEKVGNMDQNLIFTWLSAPELHTNKAVENNAVYNLKKIKVVE